MDRTGLRLHMSLLALTLFLGAGALPATAAATESDLSVSVVGSPEPVPDHTDVTYTVTATNAGPDDTYAIVHDNVPGPFDFRSYGGDAAVNCLPTEPAVSTSVVCDPHLAPGESKTLTVTVSTFQCVTDATDSAGIELNSPDRTDPNPANNQAHFHTTMTSTDGSACGPASQHAGGGGGDDGRNGGGGTTGALKLDRLVLAARSFRPAASGPSLTAAKTSGALVTYRLSRAATAQFFVQARLPGRRAKGKCSRPTRSNRRGRACTRTVPVRGRFVQAGRAGANRFHFTGRVGGRKLRPGRYELDAYAVDDATGKPASAAKANFAIVP